MGFTCILQTNIVLNGRCCDFKPIYFTLTEKKVLTTYTYLSRFCFQETTPVRAPNVWANENPNVETRSRESNSGPYDCESEVVYICGFWGSYFTPFLPIFPNFSKPGPLFLNLLKILNITDISYNPFIT